MRKKLADTNPYLKDSRRYNAALNAHVVSTSAIEGVRLPVKNATSKHSKKEVSGRKP